MSMPTTPEKGARRSGRARGQGFLAAVIVVAVVAAGVALDRLGARVPGAEPEPGVTTGAWFCPHGGGRDWTAWISVANPDEAPATVRVTSYGEEGAVGQPQSFELPPRSTEQVEVPANQLGSGTVVEVFGSRGAAGWVLQAPETASGSQSDGRAEDSDRDRQDRQDRERDQRDKDKDKKDKDRDQGQRQQDQGEQGSEQEQDQQQEQEQQDAQDDNAKGRSGPEGTASGVAAEPCRSQAGNRFLLPDASTARGEDAFLVLMNPFSAGAVFTVRLTSGGERVTTSEQVLRPRHVTAIRLNETVLGEPSLVADVRVSVGRVVPSTLGVSAKGGIRSSVGIPAVPTEEVVLPSGQDAGTTALVAWNPTMRPERLTVELLSKEGTQTAAGAQNTEIGRERADTFDLSTLSPSALAVGPPGIVAARRTGGVAGDVGVTTGGTPSEGPWIVMPANTSERAEARLILAAPGDSPVQVTVTPLGGGTGEPRTITLEPGTASLGPDVPAEAAALVEADGPVVPVFASYSNAQAGYAVSAGIDAEA